MRLTVAHLKPWIVTALVVLVILLAGGIYLTRTAVRDQPLTGPSWAPGSLPTSASPASGHTKTARPGTSQPGSGSSSSSTSTQTSTGGATTPSRTSPPSVKVPHVLVAGPTVDDVYPDDSGCHVFWMRTPRLRATVVDVSFDAGATPMPDPQASGDAHPMRVEYVACHGTGEGAPYAEVGCRQGRIISTERGCGVRFVLTGPTRIGVYRGVLNFDFSVVCTGTEVTPCSEIDSPHLPSVERPVRADWSTNCTVELTTDNGFYGDSALRCSLVRA